jgi:hypothetical protein
MNKPMSINNNNYQGSNACNTNFVYSNCNPLNRSQWKYQTNKVPQGMDPTYFNVMNSCWICNNAQEIAENQYLCNRNFFSGATIAYSQLYTIAHKQMARDCLPNHSCSARFAHKP